jgi:hypothetical protein
VGEKYWLDADTFEVIDAHAYNMSPGDRHVDEDLSVDGLIGVKHDSPLIAARV